MYQPIPDELTPEEEIAATILRIPPDQFPDQQARAELARGAQAQHVPAGQGTGQGECVGWWRQSLLQASTRRGWAGTWAPPMGMWRQGLCGRQATGTLALRPALLNSGLV